ncbi:RusA family crossover junction endodeoxyribonuclease [Enterococcus larvae]|uniref:RusA family crossover junction endodeoxyribonuclease n=1 Tax=Enterococcus larvae TaxID=2794352 RepID=UPI003F2BB8BF
MSEIRIIVHGDPVPQGRPRFTVRGKFVRVYDEPKSKTYKKLVASAAVQKRPAKLLTGALQVDVKIYKRSLKSFSKKKAEQAERKELRPTTKPDADNYAKGILDALKGIVWEDDGQVVRLICEKFYSAQPRAEITVRSLEIQQESLF